MPRRPPSLLSTPAQVIGRDAGASGDHFRGESGPAEPRWGRRTALTLPLRPPPQKNRAPPSDSRPDTLTGRHHERFQDFSRSRIDSPHLALVTFPGAVPELAVGPGDPGDEAIGLDRAKNRSGPGIDLIDRPVPILPHPERPFGPREPRVTTAAGRRDRGEHTAGLRIDLVDAVLRELKQVLAVEGRSRMPGDIDRAQDRPARRIEGVQSVSGRETDTAGCPSCSAIAGGFNGVAVHLANHDVTLCAVSRAPLAKPQAYKRRMGWSFAWASSPTGARSRCRRPAPRDPAPRYPRARHPTGPRRSRP
jgi:hypothetical protein